MGGAGGGEMAPREVGRGEEAEVAKLQIFDGMMARVAGFITAYKLYIRMRMRKETVEGQIQWILSYVQGRSADVWKENIIEKLESGKIEYEIAEDEAVKAAELRKIEQGGKTMEEFVQKFKRVARGSGYKRRLLMEKFKRGMNGGIRRKLMEVENPLASIEQWYKRTTVLDKNWRESRREKERLREKKEIGGGAPKQEQRQIMPQPLVWQRRQMPSQQATTGPTLMEGVERTNTVVIRGQGQGQDVGVPPRQDPYAMEVY